PSLATGVLHHDQELVLRHPLAARRTGVRGKRGGGTTIPRQRVLVEFPIARHVGPSSAHKNTRSLGPRPGHYWARAPAGALAVENHTRIPARPAIFWPRAAREI